MTTVAHQFAVDPNIWGAMLERTRTAQRQWSAISLAQRLEIVRTLRYEIGREQKSLLNAFQVEPGRHRAEKLISEIIPLAEACRFLEREAKHILAPLRLNLKYRPLWLRRIEVEERRDPVGVILIIGPANYPLFLPGVQTAQALVAGNTVIVKPGRGGARLLAIFRELALRAGVPKDAFMLVEEDISPIQKIIAAGVDKIILTGSVQTGRDIYRLASQHLTPLILELSGYDPIFIQKGADLARATDAIAFGTRWNGGETCIAPRRIFAAASIADQFERLLSEKCPDAACSLPITRFRNDEEALQLANSPFALGASVFGEPVAARAFAARVHAGVVVVNDIIAPTADPRVAFGGRGQSGFGSTRGAEGLRQLTAPKVVIVQRGRRLRHLEPLSEDAEELFGAYLSASHSSRWRDRVSVWARLLRAAANARRRTQ